MFQLWRDPDFTKCLRTLKISYSCCIVNAFRFYSRVILLLLSVIVVTTFILLWTKELVHIKLVIGVGFHQRIFDSSTVLQRHLDFIREDARNLEPLIWDRKIEKEPKTNIAFLKVHKAASSTVQNILFRFGLRRNLTFVLPRPPGFYWRNVISMRTSVSKRNVISPPTNKTFNILCSHVIYNREAFRSIMPNSTKYIGILREPHSQFLSMLRYTNSRVVFNKGTFGKDPIAKYLENPSLYEYKDPYDSYTNNRMAVEFGFPGHLFKSRNMSGIQLYLKELDKDFDLVMITEMFDESLVLLKRVMSWNIKDIIYASLNKNRKKHEAYRWLRVSAENFNKWKLLDVELYRYFRKRLFERIRQEGRGFKQEVQYFKNVQRNVKLFCDGPERTALTFDKSEFSDAFQVSRHDCWLIGLHEIKYVDIIRYKQYPELGVPKELSFVDYNRTIGSIIT
ncbi:hypothetical protein FSP39_019315 [Pinctada imbricata]|uniref:Uncharacterized protein n=1 Tax=Pinctada imbricata TaxID=66713 RepID=A0AA89C5P2_PINIB|nr:hypothetical protein FSP39_019315 [Pinctada imbricata]